MSKTCRRRLICEVRIRQDDIAPVECQQPDSVRGVTAHFVVRVSNGHHENGQQMLNERQRGVADGQHNLWEGKKRSPPGTVMAWSLHPYCTDTAGLNNRLQFPAAISTGCEQDWHYVSIHGLSVCIRRHPPFPPHCILDLARLCRRPSKKVSVAPVLSWNEGADQSNGWERKQGLEGSGRRKSGVTST